MRTRIETWGKDLALRIPSSLAAEMGLHDGSEVELKVAAGELRVSVDREPLSLEALVSRITDANRHGEWPTSLCGGEEW